VQFVIDIRISATVADDVTLLIDSRHGPPTGYCCPATNELASPGQARPNETFVVITHQSIELYFAHLPYTCNECFITSVTHKNNNDIVI